MILSSVAPVLTTSVGLSPVTKRILSERLFSPTQSEQPSLPVACRHPGLSQAQSESSCFCLNTPSGNKTCTHRYNSSAIGGRCDSFAVTFGGTWLSISLFLLSGVPCSSRTSRLWNVVIAVPIKDLCFGGLLMLAEKITRGAEK